jgi:sigma-B regulation protein RsbU (phosphoserine phosphatase)
MREPEPSAVDQPGADLAAQNRRTQRVERELELASQIQAGFLPEELPRLPGWQLTAAIHPAREMSGDFYDMFLLPDGRLCFLIADVADKGMGAALFMALTRTVLRIFVIEHGQRPEHALRAANRHILRESSSGLFVTVFLGILEPATGKLVYCNAGHNPPLLQRRDRRMPLQPLGRTGIPVGVSPDAAWKSLSLEMKPGDALLLYTDGVTEAQDPSGGFFGESGLVQILQHWDGAQAGLLQETVLQSVEGFVRQTEQQDDITTMVVLREG